MWSRYVEKYGAGAKTFMYKLIIRRGLMRGKPDYADYILEAHSLYAI